MCLILQMNCFFIKTSINYILKHYIKLLLTVGKLSFISHSGFISEPASVIINWKKV